MYWRRSRGWGLDTSGGWRLERHGVGHLVWAFARVVNVCSCHHRRNGPCCCLLATSLFGDVAAALREHGSATLDKGVWPGCLRHMAWPGVVTRLVQSDGLTMAAG